MRYSTALLPLAASATALVIPDEVTAKQLVLETKKQVEDSVSSWWESAAPGVNSILSSAENILQNALYSFDQQVDKLGDLLPKIEKEIEFEVTDFLPEAEALEHGRVDGTNLTVYQSIHASNYTKRFAALVDDFPDLVEKLNSTSSNVTVFIPSNHAFEKIPDHFKEHKPPKEIIEKIIKYHIVPGFYPVGRVLAHHTLPTALDEEALGGRPQRLRVSVSLFGIKLNFHSKVVWANLITKNGAVHGVDSFLVPPPPAKTLISLFPSKFSTLELAAEKTGFAHHGRDSARGNLTGLTVFAPTNHAFAKLGPAANAFLFNTERGLRYLRALLAYHVVANETLYSDVYYGRKETVSFSQEDDDSGNEEGRKAKGVKHYHLDLPTLLDDAHLAIDVTRWLGFINIRINGRVDVAVQDGVAHDGVIQVVDSILIPPHKHKGEVEGEIDVEELIERLEPFVEKGEREPVFVGEL